ASHSQPTWTLMLPVDQSSVLVANGRTVEIRGRGVLLPPLYPNCFDMDGAHVVMNLEAWMTPRSVSRHLRVLEHRTTERLLRALDLEPGINVDAAVIELTALVGGIQTVDARLGNALEHLAEIERLDDLAADVGLTPASLRREVRSTIGVPLSQLRLW